MAITENELKSLARLARLGFSEGEIEEFRAGFGEIIEFADRINSQVAGETSDIREVGGAQKNADELRCDEVEESLENQKILSNVEGEGGYFRVKRVVK